MKWRVFAFLLYFCVMLFVVLGLFQTVMLAGMYKTVRRAELRQAMALVAKNIDSGGLDEIFRALEQDKAIIVMPTAEFTPPPLPKRRHWERPPETVTLTKNYALQNGEALSLTFYAVISPAGATVSTLLWQLCFVIAIMILVAVTFAVVLSRWISRPIEQLNRGAKELAAGRYDTRFSGRGFKEIRELSDTLNLTAAELAKAESLRRELMANISHDLRTPLALIYSYAELMRDFPDEVTPEQTGVILEEVRRLSLLVTDILDVSQLESGAQSLTLGRYNLAESLGATVERVAALVKKDGYTFVFAPGEPVMVIADETKITQAFYNLLINAVHYAGADKTVEICLRAEDGFVAVEVRDHGAGVDPEELPRIWERYYQSGKAHKRAIAGTGLGLSIVKKVVELHGGECGVESCAGQGSCFWFRLRLA